MEGGFLGLGVHSRAGSTPCLLLPARPSCPPLVSYSITLGTRSGSACPFTAPGQRQRRRGLCPLPPGYPAKLPELRRHFASSSRSEPPGSSGPTRRPPISAEILGTVCSYGWFSSRDPLSPTTAHTVSATVALPWARTRVRCGDPAQWKGPEGFPRWPGDTRAENVPARSIHSAPAGLGKWGRGGEAGAGLGSTVVGAGGPGRFSALFPPSEQGLS